VAVVVAAAVEAASIQTNNRPRHTALGEEEEDHLDNASPLGWDNTRVGRGCGCKGEGKQGHSLPTKIHSLLHLVLLLIDLASVAWVAVVAAVLVAGRGGLNVEEAMMMEQSQHRAQRTKPPPGVLLMATWLSSRCLRQGPIKSITEQQHA